ncbi:MAG: 6-bladed beta-propeller, partial [Chitinivibrionia bacterium]|nr:6-bladed beta-propeller [Chitinivibrionia bacterium]
MSIANFKENRRLAAVSLLTVVLCALTAASPAGAGKWQGKEITKEGVLHVMNPPEAMEPAVTVKLKELWRLGGETESEDEFFGLISRIVTDKSGNVYLLDTQLSEVKIFSPDGEYLRTIGRAGEGPGEFRTPTGMFFTPEGKLGILQVAPGKIVLLTPEGEPAGEYPLPKTEDGGFLILRNGASRNNSLVLAVSKNAFSEGKFDQTQYLCSLNPDGTEKTRYYEEVLSIDFANPVMDDSKWNNFNNRWTLGSDGRVFAAPLYDQYAIHTWKADGTLDRIIEREYKLQKRTQEELDLVNKILQVFVRQIPNGQIKVHDYNSNIEQIHTREDVAREIRNRTGL